MVGCSIVFFLVLLFRFALLFVLVFVLVLLFYFLLIFLLLLLLLFPKGQETVKVGESVGGIVGGVSGGGVLGFTGLRWGVSRWENGSRGYSRAKLNHVQGSQSKSIRKAIYGLPRGF